MEDNNRSLYSVIPASVRYDKRLRPNAKLLYGELSALTHAEGYCWASNQYLADLFELATKTIEGLLKQLSDAGHIRIEVERDPETNAFLRRKIWISGPAGISVPPPLKIKGTSPQNKGDPPLKIKGENNTSNNNTSNNPPIVPPEGEEAQEPRPRITRPRRAHKSVPTWQPERFEKFWQAYPRDEERYKAVEVWDKLAADDALLDEIAAGLKRAMASESWRSGIGIPYAWRWLRDHRWTEHRKSLPGFGTVPPPDPQPARMGWD